MVLVSLLKSKLDVAFEIISTILCLTLGDLQSPVQFLLANSLGSLKSYVALIRILYTRDDGKRKDPTFVVLGVMLDARCLTSQHDPDHNKDGVTFSTAFARLEPSYRASALIWGNAFVR